MTHMHTYTYYQYIKNTNTNNTRTTTTTITNKQICMHTKHMYKLIQHNTYIRMYVCMCVCMRISVWLFVWLYTVGKQVSWNMHSFSYSLRHYFIHSFTQSFMHLNNTVYGYNYTTTCILSIFEKRAFLQNCQEFLCFSLLQFLPLIVLHRNSKFSKS